jgi:hypothetical protein
VLRIHDILVWIRIRGSMPLTNGSADPDVDPDPAIFVTDLQDANKKIIFTNKFYYRTFEGTFTVFISLHNKIKSKKRHKTVGIKVFLTILA